MAHLRHAEDLRDQPVGLGATAGTSRIYRSTILCISAIGLAAGIMPDLVRGPAWIAVTCAALMAALVAFAGLEWFSARSPLAERAMNIALSIVTILGGVLVPFTGGGGWGAFGGGAVLLAASLSRSGMIVTTVVGAGAVLAIGGDVILNHARGPQLATTLIGVLGLCAAAYGQRTGRLRREQELQIVRQSERLIEEQERTARETARAGALEERARIARDLHDVLAHSLGGLVVQLDAAVAQIDAGTDPALIAERIRRARALAGDGLAEAREAVRELRDDDGDAPTDPVPPLAAIARGTVAEQIGLVFDTAGDPDPLPARVVSALAAVLREAITNIQKHAPGARAVATLAFDAGEARLEIMNAVTNSGELGASGAGYGLTGLRERMAHVGGTLDVNAAEHRFILTATWRYDA